MLIWGRVIRHDKRSVPKLYLEHGSAASEENRLARQGCYALSESTFDLPELF